MDLLEKISLKEVSKILDRKFVGDENHLVSGLNEIHNVQKGDLIYCDHPKYYKLALNSLADTIIVNQEMEVPEGKAIIISENPFEDYKSLPNCFFQNSIHLNRPILKIYIQLPPFTQMFISEKMLPLELIPPYIQA